MNRIPKLTILLPSIVVAWLIGCVAVHGPLIFAYLAMHAVTTGIFAAFMWRTERKLTTVSLAPAASVRPATATKERTPARADRKAAVA